MFCLRFGLIVLPQQTLVPSSTNISTKFACLKPHLKLILILLNPYKISTSCSSSSLSSLSLLSWFFSLSLSSLFFHDISLLDGLPFFFLVIVHFLLFAFPSLCAILLLKVINITLQSYYMSVYKCIYQMVEDEWRIS